MATGPCFGCGFELDGDGNLAVVGATDKAWPYTAPGHADPDAVYCDTASGRLWSQPWNLPWGVTAYAKGCGTGAYQPGSAGGAVGTIQACGVNVTFKRDRVYLVTGTVAVQAEVATIFEAANPYKGAILGGVIYNDTIASIMVGQSCVSPYAGYANTFSMSCIVSNNTGGDLVRTWSLRTYGRGLINVRLYSYAEAYLLVQDIGPRL